MNRREDAALTAAGDFTSAISLHAVELLLGVGLTLPQARALRLIDNASHISGRELARVLHVSPASVVPLCDRLEGRGYIERARDTVDRRVCWFRPTDAGKSVLARLSMRSDARIRAAVDGLSAADRSRAPRILGLFTVALTEPDVAVHTAGTTWGADRANE